MSCWSAIGRAQTTGRKIYVANYASSTLGVFPINAKGNVSSLTKFGVDNEIVAPTGVALDAKGKIYVANDGVATGHPESDSVRIYPADSNGIAAPIGGGSNYSSPQAIAVGRDGTTYVANGSSDGVSIFGPGADGKLRMRTIVNGVDDPSGLAVDRDGNLYVVNSGSQSVTVYGPRADGEDPPIRKISGEKTGLKSPVGIALDGGRIYVTDDRRIGGDSDSITIFAAGANGNAAPIATISGLKTQLQLPQGIAVDTDGKIYVANGGNLEDRAEDAERYDDRPRADPADSVTVYAAGSTGNVAPIARINGPLTGLGHPMGIAVGP